MKSPSAAFERLAAALVGSWKIDGDAQGQTRFERPESGHFLFQHVELEYAGRKIRGLEVLGHFHPLDTPPTKEIWTRFYKYDDGLTLDYVYELKGETITIWFGKKGSNNFYRGRFSRDRNALTGAWQWPGGGYRTTHTRVK
jgi:hypothetical protein